MWCQLKSWDERKFRNYLILTAGRWGWPLVGSLAGVISWGYSPLCNPLSTLLLKLPCNVVASMWPVFKKRHFKRRKQKLQVTYIASLLPHSVKTGHRTSSDPMWEGDDIMERALRGVVCWKPSLEANCWILQFFLSLNSTIFFQNFIQ